MWEKKIVMSEFVNPYNFVRTLECNSAKKSSATTHEKFSGISGKIKCQLTTKTRTLVAGNRERNVKELEQVCNYAGIPILPASSLKGVIRSVAETVANGCYILFDKRYSYTHIHAKKNVNITNKISGVASPACSNKNELCICCRLFGMISKQTDENEEGRFVFQGKVMIGDSIAQNVKCLDGSFNNTLLVKGLMNPKPHHEKFYVNTNKIRGRKFYYHRNDADIQTIPNVEPGPYDKIFTRWIKRDSDFNFSVEFMNLTEEELGLLLYALELEEILVNNEKVGMYHKIGMAKALGFGSCEIKITELKLIDNPQSRYMNLESGLTDAFDRIQSLKEAFFQSFFGINWTAKNTLANISDLQKIMSLNGYQTNNIHYPSPNWFSAKPDTELPTIEQVFNNINMLVE